MLKSSWFWAALAFFAILLFGTVFVPIIVGTDLKLRTIFEVLPVSVLVFFVVKFCLDSVFGSAGKAVLLLEKYVSEKVGVYLFSVLILLIVVVSVLTFLS